MGSNVFLFGSGDYESTFDFFDLHSKKWASQEQDGAYFDKGEDKAYFRFFSANASSLAHSNSARQLLITPAIAEKKKWTNLNVVKLEDWDTVRYDERFEATTGKAIAIPNPWDE